MVDYKHLSSATESPLVLGVQGRNAKDKAGWHFLLASLISTRGYLICVGHLYMLWGDEVGGSGEGPLGQCLLKRHLIHGAKECREENATRKSLQHMPKTLLQRVLFILLTEKAQ